MQEKLIKDFDEYGIELKKFLITTIAKPEDDKQYLEFKELYFKRGVGLASAEASQGIELIHADTEAKKKIIDSKAEKTKREQEGYNYQEEKGYEIGKEIAKNNAIGQFTNIGVGLGMMSGISNPISKNINNQVVGAFTKGEIICPNCGKENNQGVKFCKGCGTNLTINKICPDCGVKLDSDSLFCTNCGRKVD